MTDLNDPGVLELLEAPSPAVISTHNADGTILSTVVWVGIEDGVVGVNSAVGRWWPANLERDPHITVVVLDSANPRRFVEIRGIATGTIDGADAQIDALAHKYLGVERYPFRQPGEQRIKFTIAPTRIRHVNP